MYEQLNAVAGVVKVLGDVVHVEDSWRADEAPTVQSVYPLKAVDDVARQSKNQEHGNERHQRARTGCCRGAGFSGARAVLVASSGERRCRDEQQFRQERGIRRGDIDGDVDDVEGVEARM